MAGLDKATAEQIKKAHSDATKVVDALQSYVQGSASTIDPIYGGRVSVTDAQAIITAAHTSIGVVKNAT